ncbi:MFS domain-containing protein [Mycena chlorophos]|uniref:MFS domain-containing protein n=1 Tax=Mycena chlorophos TaxID=658473 RepID=A0A8H6TB68_MYCCL|nr:MFS domain-containing protein [Mycena chlorophos]
MFLARLSAVLLVVFIAALSALADAPAPAPSPVPSDPNYYYPTYACAAGTDTATWTVDSVNNPSNGTVECYIPEADCYYYLNGTYDADDSNEARAACPRTATPASQNPSCNSFLCPKTNPDGSVLSSFDWYIYESESSCSYDDGSTCAYDVNGNFITSESNGDCPTTVIPASCASNPNRRRYRKEDNFTAMLRKKAVPGEAVRVRQARPS